MRMPTFAFAFALSIAVLLTVSTLRAAQIKHHNMMVDSDADYTACLSCHDGVLASEVSPCMAKICFLKRDHPVDRSYPPQEKSAEFAALAAAERAGIRFRGGKIDCISCHDLLNDKRYHLRVENRDSRLCQSCHLK